MIKRIYVCDRCEQELKERRISVTLVTYPGQDNIDGDVCTLDYCPACAREITAFLKNQKTEKQDASPDGKDEASGEAARELKEAMPEESKPDPPIDNRKKTAKPKRKTLDKGKIMALKKAGWSNEKIADEMGTTKSSIASTVYMEKKKMQESKE